MQFGEIVAPTIKELFIQRIETMILSGELAVGEQLPSERELAEKMKISKTVVHAGITDMERKGFLKVIPRRGIFVEDYANNGTLEALISIMQHNGGQLDSRNVRSMLEMRYAVENLCLIRIMEHPKQEVLARLNQIAAEVKSVLTVTEQVDYHHLAELHFTFHHYICAASGNTIAPLIMNAFRIPATRFWANSARVLGLEESISRLLHFNDLIQTGDLAGAIEHLKWICDTSDNIVRE